MFSYSGDPSTSLLDEIRFYSQDIDETDPLVSDEEINYLIVNWEKVSSSPLFLAAVVCDVIAAKFTREISFSADGISVGATELQNKFVALADSLRAQYQAQDIGGIPSAGGMLAGEEYDSTIEPLVWAKGQHDNPQAGQQEYGGFNTYHGYPERDGTYST
jgi:hypothetical protein